MKRVIFLIYHGMGHFNACFKLAQLLQHNYEVIFAGVAFFKHYVRSQNFQYYTLNTVPFGLGFETWVSTMAGHKFTYLHTLRNRWRNKLFEDRRNELGRLIADLTPHALLIDSLQSTDLIALYDHLKARPVRVALVQTMPPTALVPGQPPVSSFALPGDDKAIKKAARRFIWRKKKKSWLKKLLYFGMDDETIISRTIRQCGFPGEYISPLPAPLGVVFRQVPEFILTPREFDFPRSAPAAFQHYVGFMPYADRTETGDDLYYSMTGRIKEKLHGGASLIYCAFSTVLHKNTRAIRAFIQRLLRAVDAQNTVLLVSIPSGYDAIKPAGPVPDHVYFLKGAPQLEILGYSDLLITHGGINSIKEAIYAGVPILAYPTNTYFDVPGTTTRMVFHGLGLCGDLKRDSVADIKRKIDDLLHNNVYKDNLRHLKNVDAGYTEENFRLLVNGLRPLFNDNEP